MPQTNNLGLTTDETLALAQGLQTGPRKSTSAVKTGITSSQYLYGYPLEAPAKKLYFIEDTLRRRIPRVLNETGGVAAHWKVITAINSGHIKASVAAGAVATALTLSTAEKSANYKTLNQYNTYDDESRIFGRKFEDVPQLGMLSTLQSLMIQEDRYDLGGNITALGAPTTVTVADGASSGGTFVATAYYISVSALTIHGWQNGAAGRISSVDAPDETTATSCNTGTPFSATANHTLTCSWTDVPNAFAYNIYCGTASYAAAVYIGTAFTNSVTLTSPTSYNGYTTGTGVGNSADQTADANAYNGIVPLLNAASSGAYYKNLAGSALTGDGSGGVVEIETMLQYIWNNYRVSPTAFFVNAQESKSIKKLAIGSSTSNAVRVTINEDDKNKFTAGSAVNTYFSPYQEQLIEIKTSVHVPPGKIIAIGETVPYPNAETPNNLEMELQQEYYGEMFARTTRVTPVGVTMIGALKLYLPGACGIISNIVAS
jgi:hypothetical protein